MLLSLPSPNADLFKEIDLLFANFIWSGKPAKLRKEILEAEIKHGGLKLHNISKFDSALKGPVLVYYTNYPIFSSFMNLSKILMIM